MKHQIHSFFLTLGKSKGFKVEQNKDLGYGPIDVVWHVNVHPLLPNIKCGFVVMRSDERGGSRDPEDNQCSLRKIEEAIVRGLRSDMDKVYLVGANEEMSRSVSGKIEWLASFGSLLRFDSISLGLSQDQQKPSKVISSF